MPIKIILLIAALSTRPNAAISQYASGVMSRTIAIRQSGRTSHDLSVDLPEVFGYAAAKECDQIGQIVLVDGYRFLVVDCASKTDSRESDGLSGYQWMERGYWEDGKWYPIELEIGYEAVVKLGWPVGRMALAHVEWEERDEDRLKYSEGAQHRVGNTGARF